MIKLFLIIFVILLLGVFTIPYSLLTFFFKKRFKKTIRVMDQNIIKFILKTLIIIAGVRVHVDGIENIDLTKPTFVVSNHRGFFDIIVGYTLLNRPCGIVGKKSLYKVPVLGYWMKRIGCFLLDRNDLRSGAEMVIYCINMLRDDMSMWICPEGTRNKNLDVTELLEFKAGAFKVVEKTNCNVLPMAFVGTDNAFEKHLPRVTDADVYVKIGKPYTMESAKVSDSNELAKYSEIVVSELIKDIVKNHNVC